MSLCKGCKEYFLKTEEIGKISWKENYVCMVCVRLADLTNNTLPKPYWFFCRRNCYAGHINFHKEHRHYFPFMELPEDLRTVIFVMIPNNQKPLFNLVSSYFQYKLNPNKPIKVPLMLNSVATTTVKRRKKVQKKKKKQTPWDKNPLKNNAPYEENVKFAHAFSSIPTVTPFLAALDSANNSNLRLNVSVSDVTTQGFKLTLSSWADTTVYHAEAGWVAHAACHNKPSQVQVGRVKKQTPWDKNPLKEKAPYEENVKFAHPFHCVPKVNVGVAAVDGAANANYRLNVTASDVTAHGFKLSMSSWADTTVYHAEASWVATA